MSADEPAPEVSPTTALVVTPEEKPVSTTIELETRRIALVQWEQRRDLHQESTKAYRDLANKCVVLRQAYERDVAAYRGRQLMAPQRRLETMKKRKATLLKKRADCIGRVVKAVQGLGSAVKDEDALAVAVADALEPPVEPKKKKSKGKKVAEEEGDSD